MVICMTSLFENVSDASKIRILKELEGMTRFYKKGNIILSSVKNEDIICIVLNGHIQIVKNDLNGNQIVIEDVKTSDIFGSISANISSNDYEIITKEDSEIILLELDNVLKYDNPDIEYNRFIKNLIQVLYDKIHEFNNHIEILSSKTIRDKLLAYFRIATKNNNSRIFYLPFNFSNLADYLATNRSAMSREMRHLKDEGLIEVKGKRIKLNYYNN